MPAATVVSSGLRVVDGGCFVSSSDEMVVMDPCFMNEYIIDTTSPGQWSHFSTRPGLWMVFSLLSDTSTSATEPGPSCRDERKQAKNPTFGGTEDAVEDAEASPVDSASLSDSNPGNTGGRKNVSNMGSCTSVVRELVLLNDPNLNSNMVTNKFISELLWQPVEKLVDVSTGQVGVFSVASVPHSAVLQQFPSDHTSGLMHAWYDRVCELSCLGDQFGVVDVLGGPVGVVCGCYEFGDRGSHKIEVLKKKGRAGIEGGDENEIWGIRVLLVERVACGGNW